MYLASIYHTVSGFPGIDLVETGNYMKVYVLTMLNSTQVLFNASVALLPPSGRSQNCKHLQDDDDDEESVCVTHSRHMNVTTATWKSQANVGDILSFHHELWASDSLARADTASILTP